MNPKELKGSPPKGSFIAVDGAGSVADLSHTVFPILKDVGGGKLELIGTGFFIAESGIFLTAKHVLLDVMDGDGKQTHPIFLIQFLDGQYVFRGIARCTSHHVADIAVGIPVQMTNNANGMPLKNKLLTLTAAGQCVGEPVVTYAYPKSVFKYDKVQELHFHPDYFNGVIHEFFPNGRDSVMMPGACMQTSIHMHGGASGGPVFNSAGKVIGVNSTGFDGTDLSFITPISEIKNLFLADVKIPSNHSGQVRVQELIDGCFIKCDK